MARQLGFIGGLCIHPTQVAVMSTGFSPSGDDIAQARGAIEAFEREGRGATEYHSKMVDLPVVVRARETLLRTSRSSHVPTSTT